MHHTRPVLGVFGAEGGTRTRTVFRLRDPKSRAYSNFATPALSRPVIDDGQTGESVVSRKRIIGPLIIKEKPLSPATE